MDFRLVLITCKDRNEARTIGEKLVEEHLAACVDIVPGIESIYRWKGKIENAEEVFLHAKTRAELVPAITARVKELHSYECPCIVAIPILEGNEDYLSWIWEETKEGE